MLEGLEISVLNLSELTLKNDRFRYDAEFSKKEYLIIEALLESRTHKRLNDTDTKIIHPSEIKREYVEYGEWFFRTQNLRPLKIENSNDVYISYNDARKLTNNVINIGDVLITRTGANYGQTAQYNRSVKAIGSSHVLIVRNIFFKQSYIAVFFNTIYGQKMIKKGMYGGAQPEISPYYILNIPIPIFSDPFQVQIENFLKDSTRWEQESLSKYNKAESQLLEALGLFIFISSKDKINVKGFKESFLSTGRLDAEYYQKKYEEIIGHVRSGKYDKLGNLVNMKKSIEPGSEAYQEEGIPFVRVSNLTKYGLSEPDIYLDKMEYADIIRPKKDNILLSKDGTVGIAYKVPEDMFAITSGAILHLQVKSDEVLPDYLTLVLNSLVVQMQAERDAGGSILQHWKPSEIEQVEIPIIDKTIQIQISELIQESFRLKKESEQLLELAKRAVEIAIEEGEERAMEMITSSKLLVN